MKLAQIAPIAVAGVAAAILAASGQAASRHEELTVVIRHQARGCHTWGVEGARSVASLRLRIDGDTPVVIANRDVKPHRVVKVSGPAVSFSGSPNLSSRWSALEIHFSKPGVYRFTTRPGDDYAAGVKTIGKDNVLRLTVAVS